MTNCTQEWFEFLCVNRRVVEAIFEGGDITSDGGVLQLREVERVIGSIRRECCNHLFVLGECHLRRILSGYVRYYNETRTHLSLDKDAPDRRREQPPDQGKVIELKRVGGLHHEYVRRAA